MPILRHHGNDGPGRMEDETHPEESTTANFVASRLR